MRRNPPRSSRIYGSTCTATAVDDGVPNHPAATPPKNHRSRFLEMENKLRKKIYDHVADEIEVVGLDCVGTKHLSGVSLATTSKQIRGEFYEHLQDHLLPKVHLFVVQVRNFDFRHLVTLLRRGHQFTRTTSPIAEVKVYHLIKTEKIDSDRLVKWEKSAAKHPSVRLRHVVGQLPVGADRAKSFLRAVQGVVTKEDGTPSQVREIKSVLERWHCAGIGVRDWTGQRDVSDEKIDANYIEEEGKSDDDMMSLDDDSSGGESELNETNDPYTHLFDD